MAGRNARESLLDSEFDYDGLRQPVRGMRKSINLQLVRIPYWTLHLWRQLL